MEADDGSIIKDGIHKGKFQYKKVFLRQQTCDCDAIFVVEQSARQGTNDNGVGIGIGIAKAKGYYYNIGISTGKNDKKGCV